jgi:hypothetical protein
MTVAAMVGFAIVTLAACTTPTQRWAVARQGLTTAQESMITLREANVMDDEDILTADPFVQSARKGLALAETQLPDGGTMFEQWIMPAEAALTELARLRREAAAQGATDEL